MDAKEQMEVLLNEAQAGIRDAQERAETLRKKALELAPDALGLKVGDRVLLGRKGQEAEVTGFEISWGRAYPKLVNIKKDGSVGLRKVHAFDWAKK